MQVDVAVEITPGTAGESKSKVDRLWNGWGQEWEWLMRERTYHGSPGRLLQPRNENWSRESGKFQGEKEHVRADTKGGAKL